MSEPQIKDTNPVEATSPSVDEVNRGVEPTAPPATTTEATAPEQQQQQPAELTGHVKTLKEAFPDLDVEVIETILDSQGGNLDAAFEVLLGMSDPTYKPTTSEIAQQTESQNQLRQDEEYARRLAREGDAHYPQNNANTDNQSLFNFQEELPIIKEKVIEAGTAAKNKIMNLYNQFMAAGNEPSRGGSTSLESGMGNLSLSDNNNRQQYQQQQQRPHAPPQDPSVDLYEWDGQGSTPVRNPLLDQQKVTSSTPQSQMTSDEEFARQLAKEDAESAAASARAARNSPHKATNVNTDSDDNEVTFSALNDTSSSPSHKEDTTKPSATTTTTTTTTGYAIHDDDDDLDDLFDKQDSVGDLRQEEAKIAVTPPKK